MNIANIIKSRFVVNISDHLVDEVLFGFSVDTQWRRPVVQFEAELIQIPIGTNCAIDVDVLLADAAPLILAISKLKYHEEN